MVLGSLHFFRSHVEEWGPGLEFESYRLRRKRGVKLEKYKSYSILKSDSVVHGWKKRCT